MGKNYGKVCHFGQTMSCWIHLESCWLRVVQRATGLGPAVVVPGCTRGPLWPAVPPVWTPLCVML